MFKVINPKFNWKSIEFPLLIWILKNRSILLFLLVLIFFVHGQSLQYFFVQDDAHAYFASENWMNYYYGIASDLQYRPNAYLVTRIIDLVFPDKAWPLRLFGMFMLYVISVLLYAMVMKVSSNKILAIFAATLNAVHPGYHSMMTLYLSAAMTGMGLLFVLLSVFVIYLYSRIKSKRLYILSMLIFVMGLLSYESAIIALPLMFLVYLFSSNNTDKIFYKILSRIKTTSYYFIPHISVAFVYLISRKSAVEHLDAVGGTGNYAISIGSIGSNLDYLYSSLWGKYIFLTFTAIPYDGLLELAFFIFVLWFSFYYAKKSRTLTIYWLAVLSIPLGFTPFMLVGVNGHTLHYVIYALPGLSVLMAMAFLCFSNKRYGNLWPYLFLFFSASMFIYLEYKAYDTKVLVNQAEIGSNINSQFYNLDNEVTKRKKVVFMNTQFRIAAAIHFGETLDIATRNNRRSYDFPQMNYPWHVSEEFYSSQTRQDADISFIFLEHFRVNEQFTDSKLHDVTPYVVFNAEHYDFHPKVMTNHLGKGVQIDKLENGHLKYTATEDLDFIALLITPEKSHVPFSLTYVVENSNIAARLVVDSYFKTPVTKSLASCRVELISVPTDLKIIYGYAAPPRQWERDEYIALTLFGVKRGESFTLLSSSYKESFDLPNAPLIQRCSHSIFDYR